MSNKTKICGRCKQTKLTEDFCRDKYRKDGLCYRCKTCNNIHAEKWRQKNREQVLEYSRNYYHANPKRANERSRECNVKRKFGLTPEQYDIIFKDQNGCCAICETHQSKLTRALAVDHDDKTKEIRGLLCASCNLSLGGFKHDPNLLEKAAAYVRQHQKHS